jgi:hypothetical protein
MVALTDNQEFKVVDGYIVPIERKGEWYPKYCGSEVEMECFSVPIEFVKILPVPNRKISRRHFLVEVCGEEVNMAKVEFPVLDAMAIADYPAIVKLYRAKRKE